MEAFRSRGVQVVAVSVDPPETSIPWRDKKGFTFTMLSDPKLQVIDGAYQLENPDVEDLALHAVYVIGRDGVIDYAKVARRRVYSPEILAAVDGRPLQCCPGGCQGPACRLNQTTPD